MQREQLLVRRDRGEQVILRLRLLRARLERRDPQAALQHRELLEPTLLQPLLLVRRTLARTHRGKALPSGAWAEERRRVDEKQRRRAASNEDEHHPAMHNFGVIKHGPESSRGKNTRTGHRTRNRAQTWSMVKGQPAVGEKNAQAPSRDNFGVIIA